MHNQNSAELYSTVCRKKQPEGKEGRKKQPESLQKKKQPEADTDKKMEVAHLA